jgi:hypothetical protein
VSPPNRVYDDAGHDKTTDELAVSLDMPVEAPATPETKLETIGRRRTMLTAALAEVDAALWPAIVEADEAKVPKTTIAKLAGVTRQTVYNVLAARDAS